MQSIYPESVSAGQFQQQLGNISPDTPLGPGTYMLHADFQFILPIANIIEISKDLNNLNPLIKQKIEAEHKNVIVLDIDYKNLKVTPASPFSLLFYVTGEAEVKIRVLSVAGLFVISGTVIGAIIVATIVLALIVGYFIVDRVVELFETTAGQIALPILAVGAVLFGGIIVWRLLKRRKSKSKGS